MSPPIPSLPIPKLAVPVVSQIVALARNRTIGREGGLPWRLPSDMAFFKATTMGKPCLMGRRTWESLPAALPGRANMVLTRQRGYGAPGARVFTDLHAMMGAAHAEAGHVGADEIMLIGGAGLYRQTLAYTHRIYATEVEADVEGDTHFPELGADWRTVSETELRQGPRDDHAYRIRVYERV